jgi:hypothetical protein
MKTYQQTFDLIAEYCNGDRQTLPLFADRWNQWPGERAANALITRIQQVAATYDTLKPSIAQALREAMIAIRSNI